MPIQFLAPCRPAIVGHHPGTSTCASSTAISSIFRATIRAGWRNITACSGPNCASSAGSTSSRPPSAGPRSPPTARSRPGPSRPRRSDWQTRTAYDFLRFEDFIQRDLASADLAHGVQRGVDLLAAGLRRHHRPLRQGELALCDLHHLSAFRCCCWKPLCAAAIAFVFEKGLDALGIPDIFSIAIATALFVALLGTVLKYTENATYVLYLLCDTIWTWEFSHREPPRMGPAHRPLRAASGQDQPAAPTPKKSSSSATAPDRSWRRRCWRGR